jgi:hypothetical protein
MKMVFDEWYGELSFAQRSAYRKHNVTPAQHQDLLDNFDEGDHAGITRYVKAHLNEHGSYSPPWPFVV